MKLTDPIHKLPRIGSSYAKRLKKLDIETAWDLLYHFPFRYEDFSNVKKIKDLTSDTTASVEGRLMEADNIRTKKGLMLTKAVVLDDTGSIEAVWFNQPYLKRTLKNGGRVSLAGKVEPFGGRITLVNPEFETLKGNRAPKHTRGLVPIYPETAKVSSKWLRSRIKWVLSQKSLVNEGKEFLPSDLLKRLGLRRWDVALRSIHFPKTQKDVKQARGRFAFEEVFILSLSHLKKKQAWKKKDLSIKFNYKKHKKDIKEYVRTLPFTLTGAQARVLQEVLEDLDKDVPMNRLIQGDVGSGKTVVAAVATYLTHLCGAKTVFMAPTEVLVDQHFKTLKQLLAPKGLELAIQTGTKKPKEKEGFDLWVGTHALFHKKEGFENVGLVIIDEQHRFGVEQRARLLQKARKEGTPHLLTLTATPIPRTLALTFYGDLDVSTLDELPPGRKEVKTFVVPKEKRKSGYRWIKDKVEEGDQVFVICPLIEESDKDAMQQVKAATSEYEKLQGIYPNLSIGLLHGQMKGEEKDEVLQSFREGEIDILVSTPVVEVGIDIPNATVMVIEAAERFGLASLHQLRGRVGRGEKESYCFLFTEEENPKSLERLRALEEISSGFDLADLDLELRGPGEIYGTKQHGLVEFRVASLSDTKLIERGKKEAENIMKKDVNLTSYPKLKKAMKRFSSSLVEPN